MYIYMYTHVYTHIRVNKHIYIYIYMRVYTNWFRLLMHKAHTYMLTYVIMFVCLCIYRHIELQLWLLFAITIVLLVLVVVLVFLSIMVMNVYRVMDGWTKSSGRHPVDHRSSGLGGYSVRKCIYIRWQLCTSRVTSRVTPLRPRMAIAREEGAQRIALWGTEAKLASQGQWQASSFKALSAGLNADRGLRVSGF